MNNDGLLIILWEHKKKEKNSKKITIFLDMVKVVGYSKIYKEIN
jgi:hypothetical protein